MKFTVNITQVDVYQRKVDATNPEEAERIAIQLQIDDPSPDNGFLFCQKRTAKAVGEENPL